MSTQNQILTLSEVEKIHVLQVLSLKNGNRTHTARALGIGIRTLQRKLASWGMSEYLLEQKHVGHLSKVSDEEVSLLKNALDAANGNMTRAAVNLGIPLHQLHSRIIKAGLYDCRR